MIRDESSSDDAGADRANLVGMNHVALEVGDVDAAVDVYRDLFAFELRGRTDSKAFLDMGDQFLALAETERSGLIDEARHLGLVVDDRDLVESRLEELAMAEGGFSVLDTSGLDLRDPWGNRIQIVEYAAIQFTKADHVLAGMDLEGLEKSSSAIEELAEKGMAPEE